MYRKNNPWVSLVAVMLLALILAFICTGCGDNEAIQQEALAETEAETTDRFTVTTESHVGVTVRVITDTATGKEYIVVTAGYAGIAVLEG